MNSLLWIWILISLINARSVKHVSQHLTFAVISNMTRSVRLFPPSERSSLLDGIEAVDDQFRLKCHERLSLAVTDFRKQNLQKQASALTVTYNTLKTLELDFLNISIAGFYSRSPHLKRYFFHY